MNLQQSKPNSVPSQTTESYTAAYAILFMLAMFYLLIGGALAILSWIAWGIVRDAHQSAQFPSTDGTITAFVLPDDRTSTDQMSLMFARIQYEYEVGAQKFTSVAAKEPRDQPHSQKPDWDPNNVRVGTPVTVFYDPENPQTSRLVTGITGEDWVAPIISFLLNLVFAGISFALFKAIIKMRRRMRAPA